VKNEERRFTLVKVIDDYYIEVENAKGVINYTVRKGNFKTDAKGANRDPVLGYCGTLASAINRIREHLIANKLKDGSPMLSEALAVVKSETDRLTKALEESGVK
jgi:hypothetical protein